MVVTLDSVITGGDAAAGDFAVKVGGSYVSVSGAQQSNSQGIVTLTVPGVLTGQTVIVEYTRNTFTLSQNIANAVGPMDSQSAAVAPVASGVPLAVVNRVGRLHMTSATVYAYAPTHVVVSMDTEITTGTLTSGDFVIQVGGNSAVISTISQSSNLVTFVLGLPLSAGQQLSITYTIDASNAGHNIGSTGGVMDTQARYAHEIQS